MSEIFTPQEPRQPLSDLNFDVDSFLKEQGMEGSLDVQELIDQKKESVMSVLTADKGFLKDLKSAVKDGLDRDELMPLVDKALANPAIQEMFNKGATKADVRNMVADILNNPNLPKSGIEKMQGAFSLAMAIILAVTIIPISAINARAGGNSHDIKPSGVERVAQKQISLKKYFTGEVPAGMVLNEADFEGAIGFSFEEIKEALDFCKEEGLRFRVDGNTIFPDTKEGNKFPEIDINSSWKQNITALVLTLNDNMKNQVTLKKFNIPKDISDIMDKVGCKGGSVTYSIFMDKNETMVYLFKLGHTISFEKIPGSDKDVVMIATREDGSQKKIYFNNGVMSEVDPLVAKRDQEMQAKLAQMKGLLENMKPGKVGVKDKDVKSNFSNVHKILGRHVDYLLGTKEGVDDKTFAFIIQVATDLKKTIENSNLSETNVADLKKTISSLEKLVEGVF